MSLRALWISRNALSSGIRSEPCRLIDAEWAQPVGTWNTLRVGRDAHETRDAAVAQAEAMRTKRIASLRNQIAALEALSFAEPPQ